MQFRVQIPKVRLKSVGVQGVGVGVAGTGHMATSIGSGNVHMHSNFPVIESKFAAVQIGIIDVGGAPAVAVVG
jgi:hypothetical protein